MRYRDSEDYLWSPSLTGLTHPLPRLFIDGMKGVIRFCAPCYRPGCPGGRNPFKPTRAKNDRPRRCLGDLPFRSVVKFAKGHESRDECREKRVRCHTRDAPTPVDAFHHKGSDKEERRSDTGSQCKGADAPGRLCFLICRSVSEPEPNAAQDKQDVPIWEVAKSGVGSHKDPREERRHPSNGQQHSWAKHDSISRVAHLRSESKSPQSHRAAGTITA